MALRYANAGYSSFEFGFWGAKSVMAFGI